VGLLNAAGYYSGLLAFLASAVDAGFMTPWQMALLQTGEQLDTLLPELVQAAGLAPANPLGAV